MSLGRIVGGLVVIVVLYAVISQPVAAAATTRNGANQLATAGHQVILFLSSVVGPGTGSQVRYTPTGGAAAGDGSSQP